MGWSLLPDALRPFKTSCAYPSITSQLWQTVEIDPLGHVRVVEVLQNFVQKCDPAILSEIHIQIAGVQQFHCRWDTYCIKDSYPFILIWELLKLSKTLSKQCDPVTLSGIHIHIPGVQQFHCRWDTFCMKDLHPFQFCLFTHSLTHSLTQQTDLCWALALP